MFSLALALSVWLSVVITVLMQIVMMWTVSPDGVQRLVPTFIMFLSGNIIPLPLLPDWMRTLLHMQPFRGLLDTPARIYSGELAGTEAVEALALGVVWCIVLTALGRYAMACGLRRLEVAGG